MRKTAVLQYVEADSGRLILYYQGTSQEIKQKEGKYVPRDCRLCGCFSLKLVCGEKIAYFNESTEFLLLANSQQYESGKTIISSLEGDVGNSSEIFHITVCLLFLD